MTFGHIRPGFCPPPMPLHFPPLSSVLQEIDEYIAQAKDRSYETMMRFGKRGLNLAANAAVTAASKVGRKRGRVVNSPNTGHGK